jgi:hypothetical protein
VHWQRKVSLLLIYYFILALHLFFFLAAAAFSPPVELFIKAKAAFEAKKAAKEENKLRMKQRHALAKERELPLQYYLMISLDLIYFHSCGSLFMPLSIQRLPKL